MSFSSLKYILQMRQCPGKLYWTYYILPMKVAHPPPPKKSFGAWWQGVIVFVVWLKSNHFWHSSNPLGTYLWPIQTNKHSNKKSRMKSCCHTFHLIVVFLMYPRGVFERTVCIFLWCQNVNSKSICFSRKIILCHKCELTANPLPGTQRRLRKSSIVLAQC